MNYCYYTLSRHSIKSKTISKSTLHFSFLLPQHMFHRRFIFLRKKKHYVDPLDNSKETSGLGGFFGTREAPSCVLVGCHRALLQALLRRQDCVRFLDVRGQALARPSLPRPQLARPLSLRLEGGNPFVGLAHGCNLGKGWSARAGGTST